MIRFIKNNKLLSVIILLNILLLITSIIISSNINKETTEIINNNIIKLINEYKNNNISSINNYFKTLFKNTSLITIIWLLGISVIGIPISTLIYSYKAILSLLELIILLKNIKTIGISFILVYTPIILINIFVLFILLYYSIMYSYILIRFLINKGNYNIKKITKKYIIIYIISTFIIIISSTLEIFILPKIYLFLN